MQIILALLLTLSISAHSQVSNDEDVMPLEGDFLAFRINHFKREIKNGNFPVLYDKAVSNMIDIVEFKVTEAGAPHIAAQIRNEFETSYRGFAEKHLTHGPQGIKDFPPFLQWLANVEAKAEDILTYQVCHAFHITDLATFAYAPTVVFDPCNTGWNIDVYRAHFAGGNNSLNQWMDGLAPVVLFWVGEIICTAATWGSAAFVICAPLCSILEDVFEVRIAPGFSDSIYHDQCDATFSAMRAPQSQVR